MSGFILTEQASGPATPSAGKIALYAKTDGKFYSKDDAGNEAALAASATDGAALTLVQSQTVSGVSSIDFTTGIDNSSDVYLFELADMVSTTDASDLLVRMSTNGGSSYLQGTEYDYAREGLTGAAGAASGAGASTSSIIPINASGNSTGEYFSGFMKLYAPSGTSRYKGVTGQITTFQSTPVFVHWGFGGVIKTTSAINAVRFVMSAGNISGTITLWKLKKA